MIGRGRRCGPPAGGDEDFVSTTSPSMVDLLVALVGGLAGGFHFVCKGLSGVVLEVAIATSLVPPLTTCGILLARHSPSLAGGAFLLFLANLAAIALGAMFTFLVAGHRPRLRTRQRKSFYRDRFAWLWFCCWRFT